MALYNNYEANIRKARKENFEKFMELSSSMKDGVINEWYQAHEYIIEMENKIEQQEKEITKYKNFFGTLFSLLPKQSSIHTILG